MSEKKRRQQTQMVPYPSRASVPERDLGVIQDRFVMLSFLFRCIIISFL